MASNIAFLGTGLMGAPMVRNLLGMGFSLSCWNRTRAKAEVLSAEGATIADTPADAVGGAAFVISMLSDGKAVAAVLDSPEVLLHLERGAIWIDMSSAQPEQARAFHSRLAERGIAFIDAPVSGGVAGAVAGNLAIMVGGDKATFDRAQTVLSAMGRAVLVGPPGAGQLAKLANQAIVGIMIGAVAEAMLLLKVMGADPAAVRSALAGGFADSKILQVHGRRMTEEDFTPGGPSRLQLKDLANALAEASEAGLKLPLTENVRRRYERLCRDLDGDNLDHAALYLELRDANGRTGESA